MPLIYTTSDRGFADRAVQALLSAGIQAYLTGQDQYSGYAMPGPSQYCIHIDSDSERVRANELLLQMGAAPEEPLRLPTGPWVRWSMLVAGVCLGVVIILLPLLNVDEVRGGVSRCIGGNSCRSATFGTRVRRSFYVIRPQLRASSRSSSESHKVEECVRHDQGPELAGAGKPNSKE